MQDLIDLVHYVNPQRLKRLSFFYRNSRARNQTHAGKLYNAIVAGEEWNDKKASKELFGEEQSSHYYKIKHDLRQDLLNSVLLVDSGQKSRGDYYAGFLRCRKELYAADVLWVEGHITAAMGVLKKLLPVAISLELPDIIIPVLEHLRNFNLFYQPDKAAFDQLLEQAIEWENIRNTAEEINKLFERVSIAYATYDVPPKEEFERYVDALDKISDRQPTIWTAKMIFQSCLIRSALADSEGDYTQALNVCWDAIELLREKQRIPRGTLRNTYLQIISFSIQVGSMTDGRKAVIQALRLADDGDSIWFRINQYYFYLCSRTQDYQQAISLCNKIFSHPKFRRQSDLTKEGWRLIRAYLSWLVVVDPAVANKEALETIRLARFLNSVPAFTKDKMGFNVSVLVVQILWLLQKKKYGDARSRLTSLKRYASRHLASTAGILRTFYFIKLLAQLENANFEKSVFVRKAQPYLVSMGGLMAEDNVQSIEVEVIPYEVLYEKLLNLLDEYPR